MKPYDSDGFKEMNAGTIRYNKNPKRGIYSYYDIHGFNADGIHYETKTHLNPLNFDINGYWYREENGQLVNTYSYTNDEGWTIDKRKIIYTPDGNIDYVKYVDGFDVDGDYCIKGKKQGRYNEYGFDYRGIHEKTGTHIDENNFDIDGYWYRDENGELINTHQRYDDSGWSRNHINIFTGRIVDSHGFNYMHLYLYNSTLRYDNYDPHGFDYEGIHRTTQKKTNKNNFDIDGYWYREENGVKIKTDSKYDDQGYDIDRLDKYKFSKNGYYNGKNKKHDPKGFNYRGIHYLTNETYDLNGHDRDGNIVAGVDKEKLKKIEKIQDSYRRIYIDGLLTPRFIEDLLCCFDKESEELIYYDELEEMILKVLTKCINENEDYFTREEAIQRLTEIAKKECEKTRLLEEGLYHLYYRSEYDDGRTNNIRRF